MDRKQAELVAAQIALENLRQRDQLLKTENEMLRVEDCGCFSLGFFGYIYSLLFLIAGLILCRRKMQARRIK